MTVTQRVALCREFAFQVLASASQPQSVGEIRAALSSKPRACTNPRVVTAALAELVEEELIEADKPALRPTVFFLPSRAPKHGAIHIPAHALPPIAMPRSTWFSALGVAP